MPPHITPRHVKITSVGSSSLGELSFSRKSRANIACLNCRRLKVRCKLLNGTECERCWASNMDCAFEDLSPNSNAQYIPKGVVTKIEHSESMSLLINNQNNYNKTKNDKQQPFRLIEERMANVETMVLKINKMVETLTERIDHSSS